jgi:hypothetical protein
MITLLYIYILINIVVALCALIMLQGRPLSRAHVALVMALALLFGTFVLLNRLFLYLEGEK